MSRSSDITWSNCMYSWYRHTKQVTFSYYVRDMPHKWWKVPRYNYPYHLCSCKRPIWRITCQISWASEKSWWGCCNISTDTYFLTSTSRCHKPQPTSASWINIYMLKFAEEGGAHVLMEKWDRSVLNISTMMSLRWEWNPKVCHRATDTVYFPCGKGKVPALKIHQYSCTRWCTGGTGCHTKWLDGYRSDIFLISLLREYIVNCTVTTSSIAKKLLQWTPCPPPLRISTWISIIVALVSKKRFASYETYFLSFLVSSVLDIVGGLRDRVIACSASDRQYSYLESFVWKAASFHSSHHPQEVSLAQFSLYVHKGGLRPHSFHFSLRWLLQFRDWERIRGNSCWGGRGGGRERSRGGGARKQRTVRFFVYINLLYMQF